MPSKKQRPRNAPQRRPTQLYVLQITTRNTRHLQPTTPTRNLTEHVERINVTAKPIENQKKTRTPSRPHTGSYTFRPHQPLPGHETVHPPPFRTSTDAKKNEHSLPPNAANATETPERNPGFLNMS